MKESMWLKVLVLMVSFILSLLIVGYYWQHYDWLTMVQVPLSIMVCAVGYIALQIMKRYFFYRRNWWDWLYYIGLIALTMPTFFATKENVSTFNILTDYGTVFLVIPVLLDGLVIVKNKK